LSWLETQKNLDPSFILKALDLRDLACQKMVENDTNALLTNSILINQLKEKYPETKSDYIVKYLFYAFSDFFLNFHISLYFFLTGS
jgi:hypothetical protein